MNWLPLAEQVRAQGGQCDFILFPRRSDPDHAGLYRPEIQKHALLTAPIDDTFAFSEATEHDCIVKIQQIVTRRRYTGALMTTCHVGPELKLKTWIQAVSPETRVIGLQHGFVQPWAYYETLFDSFDYLGVFGKAFLDRLSSEFRERLIPLSLPILDSYYQKQARTQETILFALQKDLDLDVVKQLAMGIEASTKKKVVLRAHPEHVSVYDSLRGMFEFSNPEQPLGEALQRAQAVVTSGSTLALASLTMKIPTVILPFMGGEHYAKFRIVADSLTTESITEVLHQFNDEMFWMQIDAMMTEFTGRAGHRVSDAYETLQHVLPSPEAISNRKNSLSGGRLRDFFRRHFRNER